VGAIDYLSHALCLMAREDLSNETVFGKIKNCFIGLHRAISENNKHTMIYLYIYVSLLIIST